MPLTVVITGFLANLGERIKPIRPVGKPNEGIDGKYKRKRVKNQRNP